MSASSGWDDCYPAIGSPSDLHRSPASPGQKVPAALNEAHTLRPSALLVTDMGATYVSTALEMGVMDGGIVGIFMRYSWGWDYRNINGLFIGFYRQCDVIFW